GIPDDNPFAAHLDGPKRLVKRLAQGPALELRRAVIRELYRRGISVSLFNGGGTGSGAWSAEDPSLPPVTAGSRLLHSHPLRGPRLPRQPPVRRVSRPRPRSRRVLRAPRHPPPGAGLRHLSERGLRRLGRGGAGPAPDTVSAPRAPAHLAGGGRGGADAPHRP